MSFQIEVGIKRREKKTTNFLLFSAMHFELLLEQEHINHSEWLFWTQEKYQQLRQGTFFLFEYL